MILKGGHTVVDWHCHILPRMDDGSESPEESLQMLHALGADGITAVVATPHFYAHEDTVEGFLERREAALAALSPHVDASCPRILLGAEVAYYPGIARLRELSRLTVEGTSLLLLEMPMARWTEITVCELCELSAVRGLSVVLAHVERCLAYQSGGTLRRLLQAGIGMQVNASCLLRPGRRRMLRLLRAGAVRYVGSDAHNMTSRAPMIGEAYRVIEKKLGKPFLERLCEMGEHPLG